MSKSSFYRLHGIKKILCVINLWFVCWIIIWHFTLIWYTGFGLTAVFNGDTASTTLETIKTVNEIRNHHRTLIKKNKKQREIELLANGLIDNITILDSNPVYRVGNILLHDGAKWKQDIDTIKHNNSYNQTILHRYLNLLHYKYSNFTSKKFRKAIVWYTKNNKNNKNNLYYPQRNEFVIHLRLGDVVEKVWFLKQPFDIIINNTISKYTNISKITFLCAMHWGGYVESRSFFYNATAEAENKRKLKDLFTKIINTFGTNKQIKSYQLVSNKDVDRDLIVAIKAKYLYTNRCKSTFAKVLTKLNFRGYKSVWDAMDNKRDLCWIRDGLRRKKHIHKHKHKHNHKHKHIHKQNTTDTMK